MPVALAVCYGWQFKQPLNSIVPVDDESTIATTLAAQKRGEASRLVPYSVCLRKSAVIAADGSLI
jgi:hypothetical protein